MNRKTFFLVIATLVASLAVIVAANASRRVPAALAQPTPQELRAARVKRGEYLVTIGGCNDCHTPWIIHPDGKPGPDKSRTLSGHPQDFKIARPAQIASDRFNVAIAPMNTAYSGPWGVSFTANLTPDRDTGIGIWTFDIFKNTIRNGRHWGVGRPLLPPMPWFNYREMSDDDLAAVFAYLRTLKPIHNEVPQPLPPASN
jgi:mono/diheme cytochrome c family protein